MIDDEYRRLHSILSVASIHQVECIMRKIHITNLKIKSYGFTPQKDTEELFDD